LGIEDEYSIVGGDRNFLRCPGVSLVGMPTGRPRDVAHTEEANQGCLDMKKMLLIMSGV